jgi:hypothetical protein
MIDTLGSLVLKLVRYARETIRALGQKLAGR